MCIHCSLRVSKFLFFMLRSQIFPLGSVSFLLPEARPLVQLCWWQTRSYSSESVSVGLTLQRRSQQVSNSSRASTFAGELSVRCSPGSNLSVTSGGSVFSLYPFKQPHCTDLCVENSLLFSLQTRSCSQTGSPQGTARTPSPPSSCCFPGLVSAWFMISSDLD